MVFFKLQLMTGINECVKVTVSDLQGKFKLCSKWGNRSPFISKINTLLTFYFKYVHKGFLNFGCWQALKSG